MPSADYKVEIVTASGEADMSVTVIGDQVVDLTGATDGQVLTVQSDGTVAPETAPFAPAASVATYADRKTKTNASVAPSSTSWANFDTAIDIVLTAKTGDFVEVGLSGFWLNEAVVAYLDVVSVVSNSPVNTWGGNGAESATSAGSPGWFGVSGATSPISGSVMRQLVSGDISAGTVTLRLRIRCATAAQKSVFISADIPFVFWARNHG